MLPASYNLHLKSNLGFWTAAGLSAVTATALAVLAEQRRRRELLEEEQSDSDTDGINEFSPLFPNEQTFLELGLPPIMSATLLEGGKDDDELERIISRLQDKFAGILEANPWLAGRFEKRNGRAGIIYPKIWDPKKDSIASYVHVRQDTKIEYQMPKREGDSFLEGIKDYDSLARSCIGVSVPSRHDDWSQPFVKVSLLPQSSGSTGRRLWMVFSMSHAIGDGHTYYNVLRMLLSMDPIHSLNENRLEAFVETQKEAMGAMEESILGSPAHAIACISGVLTEQLVRLFGPKSARIQTLLLQIDPDQIKNIKEEYVKNGSTTSNGDSSFISTNDIVTSWITTNCHCEHALMAVNFRGKLKQHTNDLAGNYENVLYYRSPEDTNTPQLIRQSVNTLKRVVTRDEPYSAWKLATESHSIVTNWSSFFKRSPSSKENGSGNREDNQDGHSFKQLLHVPVCSKIPRSMVIGVLFQENPDQLSLLLSGSPQNLRTLARGAPFTKKPSWKNFEIVEGLDEVLDRYDGFLVDQWGVMHDGKNAFEGAIDCIATMATKYNKSMVILSNSPSPNEEETLAALEPMGFNPKHFAGGAVTSGYLAVDYIRKESSKRKAPLKVLIMAWKSPAAPPYETFLRSCGDDIEIVSEASRADMLVVQGNEILLSAEGSDDLDLGDFVLTGNTNGAIDRILGECARHSVPLLCIDPDLKVVNPDDTIFFMPGRIAQRYEEEFNGNCVYFGKPYLPMFKEGIRRLNEVGVTDLSRIAMIGDSLHHDVQGAATAGVDCIFLLGGVHRPQLGNKFGETVRRSKLEGFFQSSEFPTPAIVAPQLQIVAKKENGSGPEKKRRTSSVMTIHKWLAHALVLFMAFKAAESSPFGMQGRNSYVGNDAGPYRTRRNEVDLGTTLVAIRYDGGVVVAADSRTSVSTYVSHRFAMKLDRVSPRCVLMRSGSAADTQQLSSDCAGFIQKRFYQYGNHLSVSQIANWLRNQILKHHDRKQELLVGLIVAGFDKASGTGKIFSLFPSGALWEEERFAVSGSGSTYIIGFLDQEMARLGNGGKQELPSKEQAIDLCRQAVKSAIHRDGSSGGLIRMAIISAEEIKEETILPTGGSDLKWSS